MTEGNDKLGEVWEWNGLRYDEVQFMVEFVGY